MVTKRRDFLASCAAAAAAAGFGMTAPPLGQSAGARLIFPPPIAACPKRASRCTGTA